MGIILELQDEALNDDGNIETLLRKAFLVARKLRLSDFEEWISLEQDGYASVDRLPQYRYIDCSIKPWNPYHGWIPVILPASMGKVSHVPIMYPIATISELYKNNSGNLSLSLPPKLAEIINASCEDGLKTELTYQASSVELHRITSAVRNKVLEWALLLEDNGIVGENLSFTKNEMNAAQESKTINNFINNFYSTAEKTEIKQG